MDVFVTRDSQQHPDDSHLVAEDLEGYLTLNDLQNYMYNKENPIRFSLSVSPSVVEYDGTNKTITVNYSLTRGGSGITPTSVTIVANGNTYNITNPQSNGSITFTVNGLGTYNINGTARKDDTSYTASASVRVMNPSYYGFLSVNARPIQLSSLTKQLWTSLPTSQAINNPANGNYLWIVTPLTLRQKTVTEGTIYVVATDPGFSYYMKMNYMGTENGFNYYRSDLSVNATSLTYYIK